MTWNYRIFRHDGPTIYDPSWYGLHEVFYNDEGKPHMYAETPDATGDSIEELIGSIQLMLKDAKKHTPGILRSPARVLKENDFEKGGMYYQFMIDEKKQIMKDIIESCLPLPQSPNANRCNKNTSSANPKGKSKKRLQGKGRA